MGLLGGRTVSKLSTPPGAVAQLGERLDRTQEVRGSSPLSSMFEPSAIRRQLSVGGRAEPQESH
jgi:hypothetical protein